MGCKQSKEAATPDSKKPSAGQSKPEKKLASNAGNGAPQENHGAQDEGPSTPASLYHYLLRGLNSESSPDESNPGGRAVKAQSVSFWKEATELCRSDPALASYVDGKTRGTPLHVACSLGSSQVDNAAVCAAAVACVKALVEACPESVSRRDSHNHVPLQGVFPSAARQSNPPTAQERALIQSDVISSLFRFRSEIANALLSRDPDSVLLRGKTLYRLVEALPDDVSTPLGPTAEFIGILVEKGGATATSLAAGITASVAGANLEDMLTQPEDDDVLALLYRRFVRQFDLSERFFEGDNSREEVVLHRERFKNAAVNTFNIIELLLRRPRRSISKAVARIIELETGKSPAEESFFDEPKLDDEEDLLVHNAVRVGYCPPDLLRYIVETNLSAVGESDSKGNLPLHHAAGYGDIDRVSSSSGSPKTSINNSLVNWKPPESYSKYVIDELLYAYPDGAAVASSDGALPIVLAIESGKKWIGGGIRSLYEAYPPGIEQANLGESHPILNALSFQTEDNPSVLTEKLGGLDDDTGTVATGVDGGGGRRRKRNHRRKINKDESHDAIMLVQRPDAQIRDVVTTMWANEEDGGVQMLGCAALGRAATEAGPDMAAITSVALMGVTAAVNAMKNHPNEPAVQEKACIALTAMAPADGEREVSFAASGAVATVVSAMQAHVGDASVQREACRALRGIAKKGGAERATVVASVSGFTALVNAMGAHSEDRDIQREACLAMEVLTSFPEAYLPELLGGQTEPLLQLAAENFPDDCLDPAMAVKMRLSG